MAEIELREISHTYGKGNAQIKALSAVSLKAGSGESIALVGPSGGGKSTLLGIAGHVIAPTSGEVRVDGQPSARSDAALTRMRNSVFGFLFQDFALLERDTVLDNVQLPLRYGVRRVSWRDRRRRSMEELDRLGMAKYANRQVRLLSGGERQRSGPGFEPPPPHPTGNDHLWK